jgi:hypothetical protein
MTELCCARNACLEIGGAGASAACATTLADTPVSVCQGTFPDALDTNDDGELSPDELFPTQAPQSANTASESSGAPVAIIAGAAAGGVCCCFAAAGVVFLRKKKKRQPKPKSMKWLEKQTSNSDRVSRANLGGAFDSFHQPKLGLTTILSPRRSPNGVENGSFGKNNGSFGRPRTITPVHWVRNAVKQRGSCTFAPENPPPMPSPPKFGTPRSPNGKGKGSPKTESCDKVAGARSFMMSRSGLGGGLTETSQRKQSSGWGSRRDICRGSSCGSQGGASRGSLRESSRSRRDLRGSAMGASRGSHLGSESFSEKSENPRLTSMQL